MAMIPRPRRPRDSSRRGWQGHRPPPLPRPARERPAAQPGSTYRPDPDPAPGTSPLPEILAEFIHRWERGEAPTAEEYLGRLPPGRLADAVELIYHEYCLAESAGLDPRPADYLKRFPAQGESLSRLFGVHNALGSDVRLWAVPDALPEAGDEIGHYLLLRELGQGGFARVFLAEQANLDNRLVVVKVSTRITPEPRLLARARHPHIVEVLWHGQVNDGAFQLICMPFLGGATLASVLAEQARSGSRRGSGRDLLAALNRVSAPEYPVAGLNRPARAIVAGHSYPKSLAWVVGRLAEALDHAYQRGVTHGDVKPSNILLTADGNPMLLDFNLAVGWRLHGADELLSGDAGGTLAYMAPERLLAIADPRSASIPRAADRHSADLYSLGMVLLETLIGEVPGVVQTRAHSPQALALALATARQAGADAMIRSARASISPALRSIVARCLAAEPVDRYKRGSELAEDLLRYETDRPLVHAKEPPWRFGLYRWARRQRLAVAAAALALIVGASTTLVRWNESQAALREQAREKVSQIWDHAEAGVYRFRRPGHAQFEVQGDPVANASHHLNLYGVLDSADWRERNDVRTLPEPERSELEIWLLEQTLRFAFALRERPDSPADWHRALAALEMDPKAAPFHAFETQCRLLRQKLNPAEVPPARADRPNAGDPPRWMEEYLLGVAAEAEAASLPAVRPDRQQRIRESLAHYEAVLKDRPDSYWGHYRAATVTFLLGDSAAAVAHLRHCIALRPNNPDLREQIAGCLFGLNRLDEALEACDKALAFDPDHAESYLSRSFVRARLGQAESLIKDIKRFELLTQARPDALPPGDATAWRPFGELAAPSGRADHRSYEARGLDRDDVDVRTFLAAQIREAGYPDLALAEFDKVLTADPDHLRARYERAVLLRGPSPERSDREFSILLEHPRLEELLRENEYMIRAFHLKAENDLRSGKIQDALQVARRGLELTDQLKSKRGESHYALARACAVASKTEPGYLTEVVAQLKHAYGCHRKFLEEWFERDRIFDDCREELRPLLPRSMFR